MSSLKISSREYIKILNINIVGVCGIRWVKNGDFFSDVHWAIIADREKNISGLGLTLDEDMK